jgi:hypothetical protein
VSFDAFDNHRLIILVPMEYWSDSRQRMMAWRMCS